MSELAPSELKIPGGLQGKLLSPAMLRELSVRSDLQGLARTASHCR
jgi:hypothetical protein